MQLSAKTKTRILLVEDNPADSDIFSHFLCKSGFPHTLHVVRDGEAAMEFLLQSIADPALLPDFILLDLSLPRKDGFETLQEIKSHQDLRPIPVIVLTTSNREEDIRKCHQLQALSFITKATDIAGVEGIVRRLICFEFSGNINSVARQREQLVRFPIGV